MVVEVEFATDAARALAGTRDFLHADPVRHNVICTLLGERVDQGLPIRCWWAHEDGAVLGVVFQSPSDFPAMVSRIVPDAAAPLAAAMAAATDPPIPGVNGAALDAATIAGAYATVSRRPATPTEGLRIYQLADLVMPSVEGAPRMASAGDVDVLVEWTRGFVADTGSLVEPDLRHRGEVIVDSGRGWLWEVDGVPVSTALRSTSAAGVSRVGFVYTPDAHRGRGYAAAVTAHVSRQVLDDGDRCILYTQLSNPTSNAVYQRLGYVAVHEGVRYAFE